MTGHFAYFFNFNSRHIKDFYYLEKFTPYITLHNINWSVHYNLQSTDPFLSCLKFFQILRNSRICKIFLGFIKIKDKMCPASGFQHFAFFMDNIIKYCFEIFDKQYELNTDPDCSNVLPWFVVFERRSVLSSKNSSKVTYWTLESVISARSEAVAWYNGCAMTAGPKKKIIDYLCWK